MRKAMQGLIGVALAVLACVPALAQAGEFAYTPLDLEKCRKSPGQVPGDGDWACKGYGGIGVSVSASDERTFISYGPRASEQIAARETLRSFNHEGKVIEWRIERLPNGKRRPFATIMRWTTAVMADNSNAKTRDDTVHGQVLVVTRLGPGGVCHVGYVDGRANPNANDLARKLADERARNFRCGKDEPEVLGEIGPGFASRWVPADEPPR